MGADLDSMPFSGIARIRDMMYSVPDPFRLDQGDVSFDAPDSVKQAITRALADNHTHYLQTNGLPRLRELLAHKVRTRNGIPVADPDEVLVTNGGVHGLYMLCRALLDPGDAVIIPDPMWPSSQTNVLMAGGVVLRCPLHERLGWRYDLDELASTITPRTRAIYLNSPHNPTGGVLTPADIEHISGLARDHNLWLISDEAYEDILFEGAQHVSPASLPGMYDRTLSVFTFSKAYAMTGLRLGYVVVSDRLLRERLIKLAFQTASNVSSIIQYGGIGALEGPQDVVSEFRREIEARRRLFYQGIDSHGAGVLSGALPLGAFYAFLKVNPDRAATLAGFPERATDGSTSLCWRMTEYLISRGRIGCVPGADFGRQGEGYVRFCFARERRELMGALESMRTLFGG